MASEALDAILPAGGTLVNAEGHKVLKANLPVGGSTLLGIVTSALRTSGEVRRIALVGPEEITKSQDADCIVEPGDTGPANIYRGLEALLAQPEPPSKILIATTDLPFLTPAGVTEFMRQADLNLQLNVSIVRGEGFRATYPGAPATFVKLREGDFTLGGLFLLDAKAMISMRPHIEAVFEARKSKFALAKLFGLPMLVNYLCGRLNLSGIEKTAQRILGCTAKTLPDSPIELAYDVDSLDEYVYAVEKLG